MKKTFLLAIICLLQAKNPFAQMLDLSKSKIIVNDKEVTLAQIWLWLLQQNAVRAGLWLFICPLFGFSIAAWLMKDPISIYTLIGVALVIGGLAIAQRNTKK